jgi:hypothetical protein
MPRVEGKYQGIPILDGEWTHRAGTDPGRGWVRVLLSDLGGSLPTSAKLEQLRDFYIRRKQNEKIAEEQKSFEPSQNGPAGSTVVGTNTNDAPKGGESLTAPFGKLSLFFDGGDEFPGTSPPLELENIFWTEAVIEDIDIPTKTEGVVRIELADERILWGMGGYVMGDYNRTINDVEESLAGKILQWDPATENPSATKDISREITDADKSRPILDERTMVRSSKGGGVGTGQGSASTEVRPWTAVELVAHAAQQLPGPPRIEFVSKTIFGKVPYNLSYGGGTLAVEAFSDLLVRYNLVLVPNYIGGFYVYDRGQNAKTEAGPTIGGGLVDESGIPEGFHSEKNIKDSVVSLQMKPLSVEVIGEKIYDEIGCPDWVMVLPDDGHVEKKNGLLGRQRQWVPAKDMLEGWQIDFTKASRSVLINYDMDDSKMFEDVVPGDDEISKHRRRLLREHLFKSYMIGPGAFRRFLPIHAGRAEGASHALNFDNMAIQRSISFWSDGWTPSSLRKIGLGSLFRNMALEPIDQGEIANLDEVRGVVTFKTPRGNVIHRDAIGTFFATLSIIKNGWGGRDDELRAKVQEQIDNEILRSGHAFRTFKDLMGLTRKGIVNFMKDNLGMEGVDHHDIGLDDKTIELLTSSAVPVKRESVDPDLQVVLSSSAINLSECLLVPPRIFCIYAWERNWGRASDYYRRRFGFLPEASPYPLKVKGIRQYVSLSGDTNKAACDRLAGIEAKAFLEERETAVAGSVLRFAGFWKLALSGERTEVSFKMSCQDPPEAETMAHFNRYQHGIEGRSPALATWTVYQKPAWRQGGAK